MRRRRGCLASLLLVVALSLGVWYGVVAITSPWAFHIGGRPTPFLAWWGSGTLTTQAGNQYPLYIELYPSSNFSRLRMDGIRPTGGVQGSACLCTSPDSFQTLKLSGTIYGGWRSTEGSLIGFRLNEITLLDVGQRRAGYFDLTGKWRGRELVMDDRGAYAAAFRSGLRVEHASVTFRWHPYWTCKSACAIR